MNAADKDIATSRGGWFKAAERAAWMAAREDRRLLATPKLREALVEVAALRAIGSKSASVSKSFLAGIARDSQAYSAYNDGLRAVCEAACNALRDAP